MEVRIKYTEIQEYILKNFQKEVGLTYVDPSTVSVSTKIKVFAFVKNVGIDLKVEKLEGSILHLVYSGKLGIELLISPASHRILPKNKPYIWALVAHVMGNSCPVHGLPMPTWWAADARVTGTNRPTGGHRETN